MSPAIVVSNVSKRYQLGTRLTKYRSLREAVAARATRRLRPSTREERRKNEYIWALKDVSFTVQPGEVVGVIGRNAAGKTTILKILSRITPPTEGYAETRGRVGSLLEVGTGFHPELTGRENVYLSGVILGLRRAEITRRFEEIVSFAEVEQFLDTPIKRYSTGMKVRLAFAVAAHLEPEILIVDEVLAVGDLAFQKKSLGKMSEITGEGRTVLFVSHNMSLIQGLCRRGIFLESGRVVTDGSVGEAVGAYLRRLEASTALDVLARTDRRGAQQIKLSRVEISGQDEGPLMTGQPARFTFHLTGVRSRMACSFTIYNHLGQPVATLTSAPPAHSDTHDPMFGPRFECTVDELLLVAGRYRLDVTIRGRGHRQDELEAAAFFDVRQGPIRGRPLTGKDHRGSVVLPSSWRLPPADATLDRRPRNGVSEGAVTSGAADTVDG